MAEPKVWIASHSLIDSLQSPLLSVVDGDRDGRRRLERGAISRVLGSTRTRGTIVVRCGDRQECSLASEGGDAVLWRSRRLGMNRSKAHRPSPTTFST